MSPDRIVEQQMSIDERIADFEQLEAEIKQTEANGGRVPIDTYESYRIKDYRLSVTVSGWNSRFGYNRRDILDG